MQTSNRQIAARLVRFSLPLILSGILQQLYSWADAFIVGHVEGEIPLAAINITASITELLIQTIIGFTLGLSVLAAQKYGAGEAAEIKKILTSFLLILGAAFTALSILGAIFAAPILTLMNTSPDLFCYSAEYLRIIFAGVPFLAIYNTYTAMLRAMSDSKAPFYAVLISSLLNVVLDIAFVVVLRRGVAGAAIATIVSQIAMTVFIIIYSFKKYPQLRFSLGDKLLHRNVIHQGAALGFPPALQSSITSLGNIVLQKFMNGFDTHTVAAITTAYRVDAIMVLPITNLGSAVSTMVAQSKGANETKNIRAYMRVGICTMVILTLFLSSLMALFGGNLVAMFGVGPEATEIGRRFFRCIACFYLFFGLSNVFRGTLEGIGDVLCSSIIGIIALATRIGLSYILKPVCDNMAIPLAESLGWVVMLLLFALWVVVRRKDIGFGQQSKQ